MKATPNTVEQCLMDQVSKGRKMVTLGDILKHHKHQSQHYDTNNPLGEKQKRQTLTEPIIETAYACIKAVNHLDNH